MRGTTPLGDAGIGAASSASGNDNEGVGDAGTGDTGIYGGGCNMFPRCLQDVS